MPDEQTIPITMMIKCSHAPIATDVLQHIKIASRPHHPVFVGNTLDYFGDFLFGATEARHLTCEETSVQSIILIKRMKNCRGFTHPNGFTKLKSRMLGFLAYQEHGTLQQKRLEHQHFQVYR